VLESPVQHRGKGLGKSASAEPSRKSVHQTAKRFAVSVSLRATARLIRELELAGTGGKIGDEAGRKYSTMFQGSLEPKAIAVIQAATGLQDGHMVEAAAALASEELAVQVDVVA
jgi:hypothetical protein